MKILKYIIPALIVGFFGISGSVYAASLLRPSALNDFLNYPLRKGEIVIGSSSPDTFGKIATGTLGTVLWMDSNGVPNFTATSTLGIGASATLSGGINGFLTRWTSASTISTGISLDNNTVAGVNATSSTISFNIQGSGILNPFNVSSSSGTSFLRVTMAGNVGIGTTTPAEKLVVVGTGGTRFVVQDTSSYAAFRLDSANNTAAADYSRSGVNYWGSGLNGSSNNYSFWDGTLSNFQVLTLISGAKLVGVNTSTPIATFQIQGNSSTSPLIISSSTGASMVSLDATNTFSFNGASTLIQTSPTSTAIFGNLSQAGGASTYSSSSTLPGIAFCNTGLAYINTTSTAPTVFTFPTLAQIAAAPCGPLAWASQFSQQFAYNASTSSTVSVASQDPLLKLFYAPGSGTAAPGQSTSFIGQYVASTTVQGAGTAGMTFNSYIQNFQPRSTSPTMQGNMLMASSTSTGLNPEWVVGNIIAGANITVTTTTPGQITIAGSAGGSGNSAFTIGTGLIYNATSTDLVGIGTITPTTTLFVQGKGGTNLFTVASSTGIPLITVIQSGNVGIGTTSPSKALEVWANQTGSVARITRDTGTAILPSTSYGTMDLRLNTSSSTLITWPTFTGPTLTFSISSSTNVNNPVTLGDISSLRTANDTTGSLVFRPYYLGTALNGLQMIPASYGTDVTINTNTAYSTLYIQAGTARDPIAIASSTGIDMLRMLPNGSTTLSSLASAGPVFSTAAGSLYVGSISGATVNGGVPGKIAGFQTATQLSVGRFLDASLTVGSSDFAAGITATSSGVSFNIRPIGTDVPLDVNSSTGTSILRVLGSGNVGINSTTPTAVLVAQGISGGTTPLFKVATSTGVSVLSIAASGNILFSSVINSATALKVQDSSATARFTVDTTTINPGDLIFNVASSSGLTMFSVNTYAHLTSSSTAPTLSSCGTSPSVNGDDISGTVTVGSVTASGCTITFAKAYTNAPNCTVTNQSMSVVNAMTYAISTSAITVSQTALTSAKLNYVCIGHGE